MPILRSLRTPFAILLQKIAGTFAAKRDVVKVDEGALPSSFGLDGRVSIPMVFEHPPITYWAYKAQGGTWEQLLSEEQPMITTDLYFEVHINIEPVEVESERGILLRALATHHGFRVARFAMIKGDEVPANGFLTTRGTDHSDVVRRSKNMIESMRLYGFTILRYKLENTLVDTKATGDDPWGVLTSQYPLGGY